MSRHDNAHGSWRTHTTVFVLLALRDNRAQREAPHDWDESDLSSGSLLGIARLRFFFNVFRDGPLECGLHQCGGAAGSTGRTDDVYCFAGTERHRPDREPYIAGAALKLFSGEPSSVRFRTERSADAARRSDRKFSRHDSVAWHRVGHEPTQFGWRLGHNEWRRYIHPGIRSSFRLSVSYGNLHHERQAVRRCLSRF